jgi:hypothetical protein
MLEIDRHQTNRKKEKISGSAGLGKNSEESAGTDIRKAMNPSEGIIDITDAPDVAAWNKTMQSKGDVAQGIRQSNRAETKRPISQPISINNDFPRQNQSDGLTLDVSNKKHVSKIIKSGTTLTDEANLF